MNKWTIKKARNMDHYSNAQNIPNTNIGIYADIITDSIRLAIVEYGNMPTYFHTNEELTIEQRQELMKEINNAIKPSVNEIGQIFEKIVISKGFIKE